MIAIYVGEAAFGADVVAPDGILIHRVLCESLTRIQGSDMGAMRFMGVAEGRIPPGRVPTAQPWVGGVHVHASLEQVTYVLEGEVVVHTRDPSDEETRFARLTAGQAIVTLPAQSLSFVNETETIARVLFICAPPYPEDDTDTLLLPEHRSLDATELRRAIERHEAARAQVTRAFDDRIGVLQEMLARAEAG